MGTPVQSETEKKAIERKRLVQDIIAKDEPSSMSRKLNEQRRMEFFSQGAFSSHTMQEINESSNTEVEGKQIDECVKEQTTLSENIEQAEATSNYKENESVSEVSKTPSNKKQCKIL